MGQISSLGFAVDFLVAWLLDFCCVWHCSIISTILCTPHLFVLLLRLQLRPLLCLAFVATCMSTSPSDPLAVLLVAVRDLQSSVDSLAARLTVIDKRAFEAGYRAKVALLSETWYYGAATSLPFKDTIWIVLQGPGLQKPYRVAVKSDIPRLTGSTTKGDWIVQGFPSLTEAQIFCAGADIAVPPLYRWKKQR